MADRTHPGLGITEIIGDKREVVLQLVEQHGASDVRVFGSVARGEARPDSDVDLLVKFQQRPSLWKIIGLWQALTELMGRDVSLIDENTSDDGFVSQILKEAVPL